jgi:hypothetical protein
MPMKKMRIVCFLALLYTTSVAYGQTPVIYFADQQTGADACAKIVNAEAQLPSTGGIVDARGFQGIQLCAGTFAIGSTTQAVQLLLGNATFIVQNQVGIFQGSELKGTAANGTAASVIQASSSFPTSTVLLQFQSGSVGDAIRVRDVQLSLQQAVGSIGIDLGETQDQSDIRNVLVLNHVTTCLNATNGSTQAVLIEGVTCIGSSTSVGSNAFVLGAASGGNDLFTLINVGVTSQAAGQQNSGIICNLCNLYLFGAHIENHVDGIEINGANGSSVIAGVNGLNNVTNLVHIMSTATGGASISALRKFGGTNAISNSITAFNHVCTDESLSTYILSSTASSPQELFTTCSTLGNRFLGAAGNLVTKSSAYTLAATDHWVNVTGTTTVKAPHLLTGQHWDVFNSGAGVVTVECDANNINGAASITLASNTGKTVTTDGTNCFAH